MILSKWSSLYLQENGRTALFSVFRGSSFFCICFSVPPFTPLGFPGSSADKESACNAEDLGSIPGLGRSFGEGNGYPLQYSCLENSMERGAWQATVHGVAKSQTWLSNFFFPPHLFLPFASRVQTNISTHYCLTIVMSYLAKGPIPSRTPLA